VRYALTITLVIVLAASVTGSAAAHRGALQHHKRTHIPYTGDWVVATKLVQRVYPGTQWWLLSCSKTEGGWGPFVYNRQGSGAAGWMQFMPSTFYGNLDNALADFYKRGFTVARGRVASVYSPLGQAIVAGYMRYYGKDRGHWYGSGC
jgi:hypothetical protein